MKLSNYAKTMFASKPITFNATIESRKVMVAADNKGRVFSEATIDTVEGRYMLLSSGSYWVILYSNQEYNEVVDSASKEEFSNKYKPQRWFVDIINNHNG